jgi:hypothetical protein
MRLKTKFSTTNTIREVLMDHFWTGCPGHSISINHDKKQKVFALRTIRASKHTREVF